MASYFDTIPFQGTQDFVPYNLPNEAIMQAVQMRTAYYEDGVRRAKSAYDTAFNLNIVNEKNEELLKGLRSQVDETMKSIARTDLSLSDNQQKVFSAVRPVIQNSSLRQEDNYVRSVQAAQAHATSDKNKKGMDYFNSDSIEYMNRRLNEWKKSDPANIDVFAGDTFATTYQPYDPTLSNKAKKTVLDYFKANMIKTPDLSDPQYIKEVTSYGISHREAREFYKANMPEQDKIRMRLRAANDFDRRMEVATTPEDRDNVKKYYEKLQNAVIDIKERDFETAINSVKSKLAMDPGTSEEWTKQMQEDLKTLEANKAQVKKEYGEVFDLDAYINPAKRQKARMQIAELFEDYDANTFVNGSGIDLVSTTVKANPVYVAQVRASQAAAKRTARDGNTTETPVNTNEKDSPALPKTLQGATTEELGEQTYNEIVGSGFKEKNNKISSLFAGQGFTVPNEKGDGNVSIMQVLDENPDKLFDATISKMGFGKEVIQELVQIGAKMEGKTLSNTSKMWNLQAQRFINNALSNPETIKKVTAKVVGQSSGTPDGAANAVKAVASLVAGNAEIEDQKKDNITKYSPIIRKAFEKVGLKQPENDADALYYNEETFFKNEIEPELKKAGMTAAQIKEVKDSKGDDSSWYSKPFKWVPNMLAKLFNYTVSALPANIMRGSRLEFMTPAVADAASRLSYIETKTALEQKFAKYEDFVRERNTLLGDYKKTTYNAKELQLSITDKSPQSKEFDPATMYNVTNLASLIRTGLATADAGGDLEYQGALDNLKKVVSSYPKALEMINIKRDMQGGYLEVSLNGAEIDKIKKATGLDDGDLQEITSTSFAMSPSALEGFRMSNNPSSFLSMSFRERTRNLASGAAIKIQNVGATSPLLKYSGNFKGMRVYPQSNSFEIRTEPFTENNMFTPSFQSAYRLDLQDPSNIAAALPYLTEVDVRATSVEAILQNAGIDVSKPINFSKLPEEVKQRLRNISRDLQQLR